MMQAFLVMLSTPGDDPITDILQRDWVQVGGWSLFLGLCILVVLGSFREWWVPGRRYRRLELAAEKTALTLEATVTQNGQLITANEITKHFFEETVPKRGEAHQ